MTIDIEKLAKECDIEDYYDESPISLKQFAEAYCQEKQRQQEPVAKIKAQWSCPDNLGKKHRERYVQFKNGIIPQEGTELFTYPPDAAKVLEDKEREIAEIKQMYRGAKILLDFNTQKNPLLKEIAELQSHINDLREAINTALSCVDEEINPRNYNGEILTKFINDYGEMVDILQEALSKTPAQFLQEFENEVIEKCAKVCDEASQPNKDEIHTDGQWAAKVLAANIRALKGK